MRVTKVASDQDTRCQIHKTDCDCGAILPQVAFLQKGLLLLNDFLEYKLKLPIKEFGNIGK